ncbi:AAA family ATPase [Oxynema sp. CENA135]|uniref:NB-ARC domain-containing protein n=1 Tax=Oxynema sp. CENA135 TaxID=984206 RepID=UPI00190A313A|nr:NB-ARC domain-containing protein [Oxynema sp. CENA135]MBK4732242.1 AAA family ATPase [Oxynema sp. CENA135]
MNLKEMLHFADRIVFDRTGKHLNDLQEAVLRGTVQRETYKEIAKNFDCSESSVRKVGSELWQILSEELDEDINKSNVQSTIQRWQISHVTNFAQDVVAISSFNTCEESRHPPNTPNSNPQNRETSNPEQTPNFHHDLSEIPKLGSFYDRTSELESLKTSILIEKAQLLTLTGIIGIGKTALVTKLVAEIKYQFEYVMWRSLETCPTVTELQSNLSELFTQDANEISHLPLIKYLQKHRCLIILDDIHHLFSRGELAGQYKPGYEDYRSFFKQIRDLSHQSCFLLIGWEVPRDIAKIKNKQIPKFTLTGLDSSFARQILQEQGLEPEENWESLINHYQGNPLWLKTVANFILELGLAVADVLQNQSLLLPQDLKDILQQPLSSLSEAETEVISRLGTEDDVTLAKLLAIAQMPSSDLLDALQSLCRRCLVDKTDKVYVISSVLKQYIKEL